MDLRRIPLLSFLPKKSRVERTGRKHDEEEMVLRFTGLL